MKKAADHIKLLGAIVIFVQFLLCTLVFCSYSDEASVYDFGMDDLLSDNIVIDDFLDSQQRGYYIDSNEESKKECVATVPVDLEAGVYKIVLHYRTEGNGNTYILSADNLDFRQLLGNYHKQLPTDKEIYTTTVWMTSKKSNFQVKFDFGGEGYLFVSRIEIIKNREWVLLAGAFLALIFICADLGYIYRKRLKQVASRREWKNEVFILAVIIAFTSLPLFSFYLFMFQGHDLEFHLMRIEGLKAGIQSGKLPVRVQPEWLNGYGYAASVFYGDIMLYFPAVLRILGLGVQTAYKCFVFAVNILTVLIAYYSFQRLFRNKMLGFMGSMLYSASIYRMVCIYVRAAVGEYCALIFLPLIMVSVYEILWEKEPKSDCPSWLIGAIGFSGLILTHVISTEIVGVCVLVIALCCWKRTFQRKALIQLGKIGAGTLIGTAWFLVPFVDMFASGDYGFDENKSVTLQTAGTYLGQLFNLFPYAHGSANSYTVIEEVGVGNEMCYSIGGGFVFGLFIFVIFWINNRQKGKRESNSGMLLFVASLVLLFMTTVYFPWNDLARPNSIPAFMISNIQFPWRLLGPASLFLTALCLWTVRAYIQLGSSGYEKGKLIGMAVILLAVISSGYFEGSLINENHTTYMQNTDDVSRYALMSGEYMPAGADTGESQLVAQESILLEKADKRYLQYEIVCSNPTDNESYIDLPLLYYKGYGVKGHSTENEPTVCKNEKGCLRLIVPAGFEGNITVDYLGMRYWRIAEMLSLVGVVAYIVYRCIDNKRRKEAKDA